MINELFFIYKHDHYLHGVHTDIYFLFDNMEDLILMKNRNTIEHIMLYG